MRSFLNKIALGAMALAAISAPAFAQTALPAGSTSVLVPSVSTGTPPFGGTFVQSATSSFTALPAGTINATLFSAVYRVGGGPGVGTLDFYYQIVNTSSTFAISNGGVNSFANAVLSVAETSDDVDGAGGSFTSVGTSYFLDASRGAGAGPDVNFSFIAGGLASGATSNIFVIRTNATTFTTAGSFSLQGGGNVAAASGPVIAAVPVVVVPEANAGLLAGLALPILGGVAVLRRKK